MNRHHTLIALFSSAAMLAACGGGSDDAPAPPPPAATDALPDSASASTAGLMSYLGELSKLQAEDKEPLDLSTFAPKTDEESEPEPLS